MNPTDPADAELAPTSPIDITEILAHQHDSTGADNDR